MPELSFKSVGETPSVSQNAQNRVEPNPIGLVTPMRLSKTQKDIFEMQYERLGMQDFGANIRPLIFSVTGANFEKEVMTRIKAGAIKFLPFIELETFEISYDNRDTEKGFATIGMLISYGVPAIGVSGKRMQVVITAGG